MKYTIEKDIRIKKWKQTRPCCFFSDREKPYLLDEEEYGLLKQCDGIHEIQPSPLADRLEILGIICRSRGEEADSLPAPADRSEKASSGQITEYPNYYVRSIDWTVTDRCNYNCLHCFHAADNSVQRNEFSRDEAMRLLDEVAKCGISYIRLTGGEPTLYPWLREVIKGIRDRGMRLQTLITNGSMLTPELLAFIKELHPDAEIMISFDGIGCHDWLRQHEGSEKLAIQAVRHSRKAGLSVHINANVNRRNASVMFDSLQMLSDIGIDRFRMIRTTEAPRWELNKKDDTLSPEEYYEFSRCFAEKYRESGITVPVVIWQSLFLNGKTKAFSCLPVKTPSECYDENALMCGAMTKKPSVQANGEVVPCAPLGGYNMHYGIHLGNVHKMSLQALLTDGPFAETITATVGDKLRANPKCASCKYVRNCQGGCPALSVISGGSLFSSDEYKCAFFRQGYYDRYCETLKGWKNLTPI